MKTRHNIQNNRICGLVIMAALGMILGGGKPAWGQVADGTYKIVNALSGQCLAASGQGTAPGTLLVQTPYDGTGSSQWTLTSLGGGQYKLLGVASGLSINVVGNTKTAGAAVQLYTYQTTDEDAITLVPEPGGKGSIDGATFYSLVFVYSGKALQVQTTTTATSNGNPINNPVLGWNQPIIQNTFGNGTLNAQWTLLPLTDGASAGVPFSMATLPDTQREAQGSSGSTPQMFYGQTAWINANRTSLNMKYVVGLGDIVNDTTASQRAVARQALYALDNTVPYGTVPGNHDSDFIGGVYNTSSYVADFGVAHFINKSYYGGYFTGVDVNGFVEDNNNHYDLISASGLDFIIVYQVYRALGDDAQFAADLDWANSVIRSHPDRRAIFVSHSLITNNGAWIDYGKAMYDGLKDNPNLFLMLCGHIATCNEASRSDTYNGHTVITMLADYQSPSPNLDMGGNGILRHLRFYPKENLITSETYCTVTGQTLYRFSIPYQMHGGTSDLTPPANFQLVNQNSGMAADLISASVADGAVVNQKPYSYGLAEQQWSFVPSENMDHFKIISAVTGKALSVAADSTAAGAQIVDSSYVRNDPGQQWDLVDAGNGWFNFRNVNSGLLMEVAGGSLISGAKIQQGTATGGTNQAWRLQPYGSFSLQTSSGNYVSTQSGSTANSTPIVQNVGPTTSTFQWKFNSVGNGYLEVASLAAPTSALSVVGGGTAGGGSTTAGANLNLYTYNASSPAGQQVRIVPQLNGMMKFYWVNDSMSWDIPGNSLVLGTILQQNVDVPNEPGQAFLMVPAWPSPWVTGDVGTVGVAGSSSYASGTFTLAGSGADIGGTADAFRFAYEAKSGDCSMVARVVTQQNTNVNAKAGVMIREAAAGARDAGIFVTPTNGIVFEWRTTPSGATTTATQTGLTTPYWVKLTRSSNVFAAYYSPDGATWTQLGTNQSVPMGTAVLSGLAVTSHANTVTSTCTFDNVANAP